MMKLPWFKFYHHDWLSDPALSACSQSVRGFFIDLICLMFDMPRRGVLFTNEHAWTIKETAAAIRGDPGTNLGHLRELLRQGVLKQNEKGEILSARLVRDELRREMERDKKRRQRVGNQ
jgi:hypothetical protein